jgi:glutamate--cysteine ligase
LLSQEQKLSIFEPKLGNPYQQMVGFEYEVQLFHKDDLSPLSYGEPGGIADVLAETARFRGGELIDGAPPNKVALSDGQLISVEPGGQFEFSSAPVSSFLGCMEQFQAHLELLKHLADRFDLHIFCGGANPVHGIDEIGLVIPNERYKLMNDYFPRVGSMGRRMMRQTCSIQATFDYETAEHGAQLLRAAMFVAPWIAGLFSNAPYIDGARTEYLSYRVPIWANTDPSRSGLIPGFANKDFGFAEYLRFVEDTPMFFVNTKDGVADAEQMSFTEFDRQGFRGQRATLDDLETHNSTIFTEARLKRTVELRSVDAQDPALFPAVLATMCGLLLCPAARTNALLMIDELSEDEYFRLPERLSRDGLSADINGRPATEIYGRMIDIARRGLSNCFADGHQAVSYLDPAEELVREGKTPADRIIDRYADDARGWLAAGTIIP